MKKILYLIILFSLFQFQSIAQWTTDTLLNTTVSDTVGEEEATPLSATTSDGKTYISWFVPVGGNYELRMQLLDKYSNKLWNPGGLIVDNNPQNSALYRYDLKVDHNDNAIVAFQDERTGGLNAVAYKIDTAGSFVWGASGISLVEDVPSQGISPAIGITASDNIIIAWNATAPPLTWVSFQKISSAGSLLWSTVPHRIIDSTNAKKYSRPSIVPAGTDDFVMLYIQQTGSFPYTNTFFAQHFDVNGDAVWSPATQVSTKTTSFFFFPKAVSDMNDGFFLGFNTSNPVNTSLNDVYVQHVNASGQLWSATGIEASVNTTMHVTLPAAVDFISSSSEVWALLEVQNSGQSNAGISVQKFDTSGTVLLAPGGAQIIAPNTLFDIPADFESTGDGMIIVFRENSGVSEFLKAIKIDYSANTLWTPPVVAVSSVTSSKLNISEGSFHNNQVVVVWEDQRLDGGIYAQNIFNDGTTGPLNISHDSFAFENFSLFPNPSHNFPALKFNSNKTGEIQIRISDAIGHLLCSKKFLLNSSIGSVELSGLLNSNLPAGIYFVEMSDKNGSEVKKWVKE